MLIPQLRNEDTLKTVDYRGEVLHAERKEAGKWARDAFNQLALLKSTGATPTTASQARQTSQAAIRIRKCGEEFERIILHETYTEFEIARLVQDLLKLKRRGCPALDIVELSWGCCIGGPRNRAELLSAVGLSERDLLELKRNLESFYREPILHRLIREVADLVQKQLLIGLLVLAGCWRQSNLRGLRIDQNLSFDEIPAERKIELPHWAEEMCEATPNVQLWQVRFSTKETKSKHEVWIVLAPELGSLIEDFISKYRPLLLCGVDSGHLFLNRKGQPFTDEQMRDLVCSVTYRYTGCRVPPHLFRNAFTHWWRKNNGDLDTLMKTLWHKDPKTAMRYEVACGVSAALERVGELRRQLGSEPKAANDPQFAKCRNCGQKQFLNQKRYCGACQHALGPKSKLLLVKPKQAA